MRPSVVANPLCLTGQAVGLGMPPSGLDPMPVMRLSQFSAALLPVFLMAALPSVMAQAPRYIPPPPPDKGVSVEVRFRYMLTPDIHFTGLGSIPFNENFRSENDIFLGTTRAIEYDDGYLRQDFVEANIVEGADNAQVIPSPNTAATANFGYLDAGQVGEEDPSLLTFHRYASQATPDEEFSADADSSMGWELNYTKYLRRLPNLGLQVGFSFNGFDSRFNDSIAADLWVEEYQHRMADGVPVPDLPEPDEDGNQPPYTGEVVREETEVTDLLEWVASSQTEELLEGGATVTTRTNLRSTMYNFRAGPTYGMAVGKRFGLQVGAGLSAIYFTGQFSAYEALNNPAGGIGPSRDMVTTNDEEWQVGGYLDASAHYQFSQRMSLFSGMQVQSGSAYSQENEGRQANVDISSQVFVHAGLGFRF